VDSRICACLMCARGTVSIERYACRIGREEPHVGRHPCRIASTACHDRAEQTAKGGCQLSAPGGSLPSQREAIIMYMTAALNVPDLACAYGA